MNLFFRMFKIILICLMRPKVKVTDDIYLNLRVLPTDLDLNMHMTNARYLSKMDLGRIALLIQTGLAKTVGKNKWAPIVGGTSIRYCKSLKPFQSYQLRTRVIGWDEKWIYMEQRFERKGTVYCVGLVRGLFRGHKGNIPSAEILKSLNYTGPAPVLPNWVPQWVEAERQMNIFAE